MGFAVMRKVPGHGLSSHAYNFSSMGFRDHMNHRVLIVDDQSEIHDDFVEMLTPGLTNASTDELASAFIHEEDKTFLPEFELLHATSGEEACAIIKAGKESNRPVAVAYIDIRMPPGIDGIETIRRARKTDRDIEIVIMTAYADKSLPEIVQDMELLHKVLYIRKPFTREEVQQITLSLVGKWNVESELAEKRRQLTASHQRLEAVLDATGDAIAMYDGTGRLVFANRGYEEILDLTEDELRNISPAEFEAQFAKRFRKPNLSPSEGGFPLDGKGSVLEENVADQALGGRLFHRSIAPVYDKREDVIGDLYVYRDISRDIEVERMKTEVLRLRTELETTYSFTGIVGASPKMQRVYALMKQGAESDITVLLQGESGTGKELIAKALHFNSLRKNGPFLVINCAAIPETLVESELFGHERGSFTGATEQRIGTFERAEGGTIFLDEIGEMQPALQVRLLRVLQERDIQRVGGNTAIPVDVRIIAATNKRLEEAIKTGEFREDLFYRIAAFPIMLPPLRERREDIPLLAKHFLDKHAERIDKTISGISAAAMRLLLQNDWPGNVRELENAIERAVLLETTDILHADNLSPDLFAIGPSQDGSPQPAMTLSLAEAERQILVRALEISDNNVTRGGPGPGHQSSDPVPKTEKIRQVRRALNRTGAEPA